MAINRYHGTHNADWRATHNLVGNFVGLEIETHNNGGQQVTSDAIDEEVQPYKGKPVICETDGSICPINGIEVITPPIALSATMKKGGYLDKLVDTLLASGVTVDPEKNYGLHINVNVHGWTTQSKHMLTFGVFMMKQVCQKIGNRTGEAREMPAYWHPRIEQGWESFTVYQSKYSPAWTRVMNSDVVEVRYPKAVVNFEKIKQNISFIYSLRAFTQTDIGTWITAYCAGASRREDANAKCSALYQQVYLTWLSKQKNFKKLYAEVAEFNVNPLNSLALEDVKAHAKASIYEGNPVIQKQAVEWCNRFAAVNPVPAAA